MTMPVLFLGHGSPMNAIEDTPFSEQWTALGKAIGKPRAILAISAHYARDQNWVNNVQSPKQIYDMYGFPKELYAIHYTPKGDPELAEKVMGLIAGRPDRTFGIDHGIWSVLRRMYPDADVPLVTMAVNVALKPEEMFAIGQKLAPLRNEGVLIFGTGSIVHNLSLVDWDMNRGYPWAERFQKRINQAVEKKDYPSILQYRNDPDSAKAFTTIEHFAPLPYVLGTLDAADSVEIFNDEETLGSISMTGYVFHPAKGK